MNLSIIINMQMCNYNFLNFLFYKGIMHYIMHLSILNEINRIIIDSEMFICQSRPNLNRMNYSINVSHVQTLVIAFQNFFSFNFASHHQRTTKKRLSLSSILIRVNRNFPSSPDTVCPETTMSVNNSREETLPGRHGDRLQAFRGCVQPHQHRRFSLISFSLVEFFV